MPSRGSDNFITSSVFWVVFWLGWFFGVGWFFLVQQLSPFSLFFVFHANASASGPKSDPWKLMGFSWHPAVHPVV